MSDMETYTVSRLRFDVFLSFQGEDTRHNITGRVFDALSRKEKIRVFLDNDGMERGDVMGSSLVEAMEDSAASVVVLSRNYANSHCCLDELAKLCDLRESLKRPMIPIFYDVDPSHVRKQNDHFAKDFEKHEKTFSKEKIERWKEAMTLVGNLSGFVCSEFGRKPSADDDLISLLVKRILAELSNTPENVGEYTVGLQSRRKDLMNLFNIKPNSGVHVLGLYGMGGIGKTTLAKAFYNKIIGNFEHRAFISNVRERSSEKDDGLVNLQKKFIKELFRLVPQIEDVNGGRQKIRESVHEKKILVVLDDVDNVDQVDALVGETRWYGEGSLIVITTRDEEILSKLSVNQLYEVKCLDKMEALKLFSYHSLRKEKPTKSLLDLSNEIVKISGHLPLAIEVFGSLLCDKKDEKDWQTKLEKLKNSQPSNLQNVLALSFESLDDEEKEVFLDIACLFLKMEITKEEVVDILKGCGFNAEAALSVLRQKSLVKIMENDTLWMHDQISDMGRQMVLKESSEDPGLRSRLSDRTEIINVLNNVKGTTSIQGIVFDFKKKFGSADEIPLRNQSQHSHPRLNSVCNYLRNKFKRFRADEKQKSSEITIPVKSFEPMKKLRLLQINNVELEGDLKLLPSELKWIQWRGCPLENLPLDFLARELAVLDLSDSGIRQIQSSWIKRVNENLKVVNMRGCHNLEAIPDLSNHKALEKLVFKRCNRLVKVPRSVGNLETLLYLDFRDCLSLTEFLVDVSGLKRLEKLFLSGCSNLSVLPENIGTMPCLKELLLDGTAIK
ncbi:Disease resistance protein RUN1 [Cardamine amara subsp. amara]|uniref:Disease resistance protein RUN1 n=1 Tax=Cardamine amara subsp. amara TaxID=228776 RepID=A0ABD1BP74_CARAN